MGNGTLERAKYIFKNQGIKGFWRGFIPGGQSVFLRNGAAMIVMQSAHSYLKRRDLEIDEGRIAKQD